VCNTVSMMGNSETLKNGMLFRRVYIQPIVTRKRANNMILLEISR